MEQRLGASIGVDGEEVGIATGIGMRIFTDGISVTLVKSKGKQVSDRWVRRRLV